MSSQMGQPSGRSPTYVTRRDANTARFTTQSVAVVGVLTATFVAFLPVLHNGFVNWDDPVVIVHNSQLDSPNVIEWAFKTTLIEHYQPLAWIAWSSVKAVFGLKAEAFHAFSLIGHVLNAFLVYIATLRLSAFSGLDLRRQRISALTSSFLFAI